MILELKRVVRSSTYDISIGILTVLGSTMGAVLSYPYGAYISAAGTAAGAIVALVLAVVSIQIFRPRYTIRSTKLRDVFIEKLEADVSRFCTSNTTVDESNARMVAGCEQILKVVPDYKLLASELGAMTATRDWLTKGVRGPFSFAELIDRRGLRHVANALIENIKSTMPVETIKINTSIVEPGCVLLVEFLKELGLPVTHEFEDINGIEQARTLSTSVKYSASFIPYSTIFLSESREKIIDQYNFVAPVSSEDQMIVGCRNLEGKFKLDKVRCPSRGSGHYELLTMIGNMSISPCSGQPLDLGEFAIVGDTSDPIVLYQPVAEIFREAKKARSQWDYVKNVPFPVDIVLVVCPNQFGNELSSFKTLVTVSMAILKGDAALTRKIGKRLYRRKDVRIAFEKCTDHFAKILRN